MINRKSAFFITACFIGAQMFSLQHLAENGFAEHSHGDDDSVCQIYLYCEHSKHSLPEQAITLRSPQYVQFAVVLPEVQFVSSVTSNNYLARAPPAFS